ncbi:hypothetical protein MMC14_007876 [Varicellaria rhodocarpa]|nr:hypothetical protein [Varicellaria rhodocarpa]
MPLPPCSILLQAVGITSIVCGVATTSLLTILDVAFTEYGQPIHLVAIVSTSLQLVSLIPIACLVLEQRKKQSPIFHRLQDKWWARGRSVLILSTILSILANGSSLAAFIWLKVSLNKVLELILGQKPWIILLCVFITWVITVFSQTVLFIYILHRKSLPASTRDITPETEEGYPDSTEMVQTSRPGTAKTDQSIPHGGARDWSSASVTPQNDRNSPSLRSSPTIAVRPSTSKTQLLVHKQTLHCDSRSSLSTNSPSHRLSQDSAFDSWDTSSVAPHIREAVHRSSPTIRTTTVLTPIPGSRSPSPAKALDGPFLFPVPPRKSFTNVTLGAPPNFSRPVTRQRSASSDSPLFRQYSATVSEEHIHPLFRTNSPTPPPSATAGTTVTAAPGSFEGLHINQRILHRMRSGSLPSSPSPLGPSSPTALGIFSSSSSFFDSSPATESECEGVEEPPTPPIPDFILTAGSRTSFLGYGRRKSRGESEADEKEDQNQNG